ncbi:tetratricopeptide repeat protein [Streptomyces sp. NPDC055025]
MNTTNTVLDERYHGLTRAEQILYRRLGVLPTVDFDPHMAAAAACMPLEYAGQRLGGLADAAVLDELAPAPGRKVRYRFGVGVQEHARRLADRQEEQAVHATAVRRLCDWVLATATAAQHLLTPFQATLPRAYAYPPAVPVPFTDRAGALAWLEGHQPNLLGVLKAAADAGWHQTTGQLVDAHWPLFHYLHPYELWIEAHEIGLASARDTRDAALVRQMLNSGAIGLSNAGRYEEAVSWYTGSRSAARSDGDVRDEGQALLGLAACHRGLGQSQQAEACLGQAIGCWTSCGYPRGVALAWTLLGEMAGDRGDRSRAVELFTLARTKLLDVGDPFDAARALAFRGHARALAGEYEAGRAELEEALGVFTAAGAGRWSARACDMLGQTARVHGDLAAARRHFDAAARHFDAFDAGEAARVRSELEAL